MFDKGFFGGFFDLDGDGKLDGMERALDFAAFVQLMEENDSQEKEDE